MIQKSSSAKVIEKLQQQGRRVSAFASNPLISRGRLLAEEPSPTRDDFQRDRDRIIHCRAFRRLKDKTQVFIYDEGDHFRTRLTHTIEVAQIARSISRALGLNEDLAEALALAHDLGHPPFGHAGERALDMCMKDFGGFDHNAQSLRVVTKLERSYAKFDGLNLTWETLEGLVKHNGPLVQRDGAPQPRYRNGLPLAIEAYSRKNDLQLWSYASAEAQAAAIADDIAYDAHDVDDGLRAGLFEADDLKATALGKTIIGEVDALYPGIEASRRQHEITRRFITFMIQDAIGESASRLEALSGTGTDKVREALAPVVYFSKEMAAQEQELKKFLKIHMYDHPRLRCVMDKAQQQVFDIFYIYFNNLIEIPQEWLAGIDPADQQRVARRVCDFIAGMTDRFALQEIARLTHAQPDLRI